MRPINPRASQLLQLGNGSDGSDVDTDHPKLPLKPKQTLHKGNFNLASERGHAAINTSDQAPVWWKLSHAHTSGFTYGVSSITLQTLVMVLRQSVVFSIGRVLFWVERHKHTLVILTVCMHGKERSLCAAPWLHLLLRQSALWHCWESSASVWLRHRRGTFGWPSHYSLHSQCLADGSKSSNSYKESILISTTKL